jgi:hypothetical protein
LYFKGIAWQFHAIVSSETPQGKPRGMNLVQAALAPCIAAPVFAMSS